MNKANSLKLIPTTRNLVLETTTTIQLHTCAHTLVTKPAFLHTKV